MKAVFVELPAFEAGIKESDMKARVKAKQDRRGPERHLFGQLSGGVEGVTQTRAGTSRVGHS